MPHVRFLTVPLAIRLDEAATLAEREGHAQVREILRDALVEVEATMEQRGELRSDQRTKYLRAHDCGSCQEVWLLQGCAACPDRRLNACGRSSTEPAHTGSFTST